MMKMLRLPLKSNFKFVIISILILSIILHINSYCDILSSNNSVGPKALNNSKMVVIGDSYAAKFYEFESDKDLDLEPYAKAGSSIIENYEIMNYAILNFKNHNVLISIGVNDHFKETPPYRFEAYLRQLLNIAKFMNKNVFFHSYMKYFDNNILKKKYSIDSYNNTIIRLCVEFDNAHYIDTKDLESIIYISDDSIHYNEKFYDILYSRLYNMMYEIGL